MEKRITQVFYGNDLLPYKDSERSVHYPLVSGTFAGSHNTKEVRFYVRDIGGTNGISWVVVSKLPNGKIGYEVCSNVQTDSELGEQYLSFDLSAYYTQVKGDLYLALRGYQGQITFEDDDNDGVYNISGDPLIEVTGTIKLSINYSPMVNTGTQVLPTDIDRIIAALSNYLLIENGFVIIEDLDDDISDYSNGQYFYVANQKAFYKLNGSTLTKVEFALPFAYLTTHTAEQLYELYGNSPFTLQRYGGFLICKISYNTMNYLYDFVVYQYNMQDSNDILYYHFGTNTGTDTFESLFSGATPNKTVATEEWVASNFVGLTGNQTITGQKTFSGKAIFNDANLYNGYLTTNSKNYFARVGVTTGQYVTYKLPYNYSDVGAVSLTLATEDYVDDEIKNAISSVYQVKGSATVSELNTLTSTTVDKSTLNGYVYNVLDSGNLNYYAGTIEVLAGDNVVFTYNNGQWGWDKLASTIDLSGYVQKTTTIAGVDLQDNITSQELTDALVFATNTDIDNLF